MSSDYPDDQLFQYCVKFNLFSVIEHSLGLEPELRQLVRLLQIIVTCNGSLTERFCYLFKGLLMVAPQTRDIVTKVIAQSGSATADWALIVDKYRAQNTSRVYGQVLGCSIESSWKLVNCLRQGRSFYELGNAEFNPHIGTFPWGPVLENATTTFPGDNWYEGWREQDWHFLKETPQQMIKKRMFNRGLQYMTGVTMQEAAYVIC